MKKEIVYSISITLLLIIIAVIGSTYAYYSLSATGNNRTISSNSEKYEIVYNGGQSISSDRCEMKIVATKEEGCYTEVEIGVAQGVNVSVKANLFIVVENISEALRSEGFKWEVYKINGQQETFVSRGNFNNIPNNNQIMIVTNETLSTTLTKFRIYVWIDGNNTGNDVSGSSFDGYIAANTEMLTGIVNNS